MNVHPVYTNYKADIEGNIYGKQGIRKTRSLTNGYVGILVSKEGKSKNYRIHRFIWECFNGVIAEGLQINHIDGDKLNNNLINLETCTASENIKHSFSLGLSESPKGEKNGQAKLKEEDVLEIVQHLNNGLTKTLIANMYNVSRATVRMIGQGTRWAYLTRGKLNE